MTVNNATAAARTPARPASSDGGDVNCVTDNPSTFLRAGAAGPGIADLQSTLKKAGFDPGTADGKFGPQTMKALKDFQRSKGITDDGVVGPQTKAALKGQLRAVPTPPRAAGDGFDAGKKAPVAISTPQVSKPVVNGTAASVISVARNELGKNAEELKVGSDAVGKAMADDVSSWKCCANFVGASLLAGGQITPKELSAGVDGLVGKLRKTGNFTESHNLQDAQPGDVVAFDHAHVMICTGRDPKTNQLTFIGSNNDNANGSQKISEGPLTKWFNPKSPTLKAWTENVVVMHKN